MANQTIDLFINETTEGREQLTKVVNFTGFLNVKHARLKAVLHANDGIGSPLPTEWKFTKFVVNGKTFFPSGKLQSDVIIHNSGGSSAQNLLKVNDVNTISIHWIAPFGAGVISPHGAVTAQIEAIGDSIPLAGDLQFDPRNVGDDLSRFTKNQSLPAALTIIGIVLVLGLVAFILLKAAPVIKDSKSLVKEVKK